MENAKQHHGAPTEELLVQLLEALSESDFELLMRDSVEGEDAVELRRHLLAYDARWEEAWPLLLLYLERQKMTGQYFERKKALAWQNLQTKLSVPQIMPLRRWSYPAYWAAACLLVLATVTWWMYDRHYVENAYQVQARSGKEWRSGDRASGRIVLPDSTCVWLNAHSSVTYINSGNSALREVKLQGEAYFEVKSSEAHPFHVHLSSGTIMVTGTRFFAGDSPAVASSYVDLQEGRVAFRRYGLLPTSVELMPGQKLSVTPQDAKEEIVTPSSGVIYAWLRKAIQADGMSLEALARQLELWYAVSIDVAPSVRNITFSGFLDPQQPLASHLAKLRWTTNLSIVEKNDKYIIKAK